MKRIGSRLLEVRQFLASCFERYCSYIISTSRAKVLVYLNIILHTSQKAIISIMHISKSLYCIHIKADDP
jgi:hypothetical protein